MCPPTCNCVFVFLAVFNSLLHWSSSSFSCEDASFRAMICDEALVKFFSLCCTRSSNLWIWKGGIINQVRQLSFSINTKCCVKKENNTQMSLFSLTFWNHLDNSSTQIWTKPSTCISEANIKNICLCYWQISIWFYWNMLLQQNITAVILFARPTDGLYEIIFKTCFSGLNFWSKGKSCSRGF